MSKPIFKQADLKILFLSHSLDWKNNIRRQDMKNLKKGLMETRKTVEKCVASGMTFEDVYFAFHGDRGLKELPADLFLQEVQHAFNTANEATPVTCKVCGRAGSEKVYFNNICAACNVALEGYGL